MLRAKQLNSGVPKGPSIEFADSEIHLLLRERQSSAKRRAYNSLQLAGLSVEEVKSVWRRLRKRQARFKALHLMPSRVFVRFAQRGIRNVLSPKQLSSELPEIKEHSTIRVAHASIAFAGDSVATLIASTEDEIDLLEKNPYLVREQCWRLCLNIGYGNRENLRVQPGFSSRVFSEA